MKHVYVDAGIIESSMYVESGSLWIRSVMMYAAKHNASRVLVAYDDYVNLIFQITNAYTESGQTDKGMPYFKFFGIIIEAIDDEEANKYKLIK